MDYLENQSTRNNIVVDRLIDERDKTLEALEIVVKLQHFKDRQLIISSA